MFTPKFRLQVFIIFLCHAKLFVIRPCSSLREPFVGSNSLLLTHTYVNILPVLKATDVMLTKEFNQTYLDDML